VLYGVCGEQTARSALNACVRSRSLLPSVSSSSQPSHLPATLTLALHPLQILYPLLHPPRAHRQPTLRSIRAHQPPHNMRQVRSQPSILRASVPLLIRLLPQVPPLRVMQLVNVTPVPLNRQHDGLALFRGGDDHGRVPSRGVGWVSRTGNGDFRASVREGPSECGCVDAVRVRV